jgi:hypothetical protein
MVPSKQRSFSGPHRARRTASDGINTSTPPEPPWPRRQVRSACAWSSLATVTASMGQRSMLASSSAADPSALIAENNLFGSRAQPWGQPMCTTCDLLSHSLSRFLSPLTLSDLVPSSWRLTLRYPQSTGVKTETEFKFSSSQQSLRPNAPPRIDDHVSDRPEPRRDSDQVSSGGNRERCSRERSQNSGACGPIKKRSWGLLVHNRGDNPCAETGVKPATTYPVRRPLRRTR